MRRGYNTLNDRYQKRLSIAKKAAQRARMAIELRTGIDLSNETMEMDLVPPPADWVDDLQKLQGIDYNRIRCVPATSMETEGIGGTEGEIETGGADADCMSVDSYAEQYIGDWVALLDGYMESYSSAHPFSDGNDYAVVSMKDDVFSLKQPCAIETQNYLYHSQDLSQYSVRMGPEDSYAADQYVGWEVVGCPPIADIDNPGTPCMRVLTYDFDDLGPCGFVDNDETGAWDEYGCQTKYSRIEDVEILDIADLDSSVSQVVEAAPRATYLVTWYSKAPIWVASDTYPPESPDQYQLVLESPDGYGGWMTEELITYPATEEWTPWGAVIRVDDYSDIRIGIDPSAVGYYPGGIDIAAIQLLLVDSPDSYPVYCGSIDYSSTIQACMVDPQSSGINLQIFEPTGAARLKPSMCPDYTGETFRQMFSYKCDFLCTEGFSEVPCDSTDEGSYPTQCYYELPFHISLEEIESGETFTSGAIATGNFNYRHYLLGMNMVGTNVIDCTRAEFPSTCYSNGFLQYSMMHSGNFSIRNHYGDTVRYHLPNAWLEHQKALTAEVVLTNPPSGSQVGLMAEYLNGELWGRPLTGEYMLRIWDTDGLVWQNIEDVQMVLDYHYWTRHTY
jgi:hypothetical protein